MSIHSVRFSGHCLAGIVLSSAVLGGLSSDARASSHMDAPLITLDDAANTTDVYAFRSMMNGVPYLTTALAVYPFEEPGIGPNIYRFDDNVRYEIHLSLGNDLALGRATITYRFDFKTTFVNTATTLQAFNGVITTVGGPGQNLVQTFVVTKIDNLSGISQLLGTGVVPPNNQGNVTPLYNQGDDGEQPAKDGVGFMAQLDPYTQGAIAHLDDGYLAFAGQRDDGFYADIQAIFDLLALRSGNDSFDSQGGFNVHTMVLNIPLSQIGGALQVAGVYATTSRPRVTVLNPTAKDDLSADFVQVARQGNPLFCEGLVALADKDLYNRSSPEQDAVLFQKYALQPELATLINLVLFNGRTIALDTNRTDIAGIFVPDVIRIDLSTRAARLAGGGSKHPTNPDDAGFSRLGIFGGRPDVLLSRIQPGFGGGVLPGGFPNGRRFGDDVVDITVSALLSDLRDPNALKVVSADGIDNVSANDIAFSKVFPYAATPQNGRNHSHH